jgi:hypothetical protein
VIRGVGSSIVVRSRTTGNGSPESYVESPGEWDV